MNVMQAISSVAISDAVGDCAEYMRLIRTLKAANKTKPINGYTCVEDFILKNGRAFEFSPLPRGVERGRMRECFLNAANLAMREDDKYIYCEGYAISAAVPFPVEHGWCVTPDGRVVDPTWDDARDYYGVAFKYEFLRQTLYDNEHYGLLFNLTSMTLVRAPQDQWKHPLNNSRRSRK